jgi:hypothetical protein
MGSTAPDTTTTYTTGSGVKEGATSTDGGETHASGGRWGLSRSGRIALGVECSGSKFVDYVVFLFEVSSAVGVERYNEIY